MSAPPPPPPTPNVGLPETRGEPWHSGWFLALAICFLATAPLYSRTLGALAVGALFAPWLLTLTDVKQASRWPKQRGRPCKQTKE